MKRKPLKHIASTGFKTPDKYFETFESKLNARVMSEESIKGINNPGFKIPNDYFETLNDNILEQVSKPNTRVITLFNKRNLTYVSGIAAALLIAFAVFFNEGVTPDIESLDAEVVKSYLQDEDISSYELAALLTDEELSDINSEIMEDAFHEESIETYLIDHIDLDELIEQ